MEALSGLGLWGFLIPAGIGILLATILVQTVPPKHINKVVRGLKVVGTAAAGAAIGTAIAPGIGTVIGAVVGAIIGCFW